MKNLRRISEKLRNSFTSQKSQSQAVSSGFSAPNFHFPLPYLLHFTESMFAKSTCLFVTCTCMDIGWAPRFLTTWTKTNSIQKKRQMTEMPYLWTSLKELILLFSILDQRAVWNRSAVWCGVSLSSTGGTLFLPNLIMLPSIDPHNVSSLCLKLLLLLRHWRSFLYTFHMFHILWLQHSLPSKNIHYLGLQDWSSPKVSAECENNTIQGLYSQDPNLLQRALNRCN